MAVAKLIVGFVVGVLTGLAFRRIPHYTRSIWVSNPPETYPEYTGPKVRIWKDGIEL